MPGLDGPELCRYLRQSDDSPYTYFILLTALGDQHRIAGMQAGADDYLSKPFKIDEIEARLIAAERVTTLHRRREALLRQARRFAAEDDPKRLLEGLLEEAVHLVGGDVGVVSRWDDTHQILAPLAGTLGSPPECTATLDDIVGGRAARERAPVLLDVYGLQGTGRVSQAHRSEKRRLHAAAAVPLLHEGRLIGALAVGSFQPRSGFRREHAELLEVLASTAAAALAALERARLDGVLLAARTAQHELNNQLAVARGYAELLVGSPELPTHLADIAEEVMRAADDATRIIRQLRAVSRIRETRWSDPSDTTINLADSAA
jgi:CheY-like chemotaxis protein